MDSGEAPWERPSSQPYFVQHLTHDSSHAVRQRTPTTGSLTVYQVQERFAALP